MNARVTPHTFVLDSNNWVVFAEMPDDLKEFKTQTGKQSLPETYLARTLAECTAEKKIKQPHTEVQGCSIDR